MSIVNYSVCNTTNLGDKHSRPQRYFPWLGGVCHDLRDSLPVDFMDNVAVVGGGGLTYNDFLDNFQALCLHAKACYVWGIGTNLLNTKGTHYPWWLGRARLLGLRDHECESAFANSVWVPCASCMAREFDHMIPRGRYGRDRVVIYHHAQTRMPTNWRAMRMGNHDDVTLEAVLCFMSIGDVVVTDSYHGVYWAQLLGKPVVAWDVDISRFFHFRHMPGLSSSRDLIEVINAAITPPVDYLATCRAANVAFAEKVRTNVL